MEISKAILVVEDDKENRNILKEILTRKFQDYEHVIIDDKKAALESIEKRDVPYEVIITDMRLQGTEDREGGIEIIKCARRVDPAAQVIVITSYPGDFSNVHKALEAGASFYLARELVFKALPSAMKKTIEQRKAIVLLNDFIQCISAAIDAKDAYTSGHSFRVREYAVAIRNYIPEFTPDRRNDLSMSALLHDIGKIGISNCLLHKPGKFTALQKSMMDEHTLIGKRILEEIRNLPEVLKGIEDHHTHYWDYVNKKPNQELSLFGKIIAIADSFDAMTTTRAYKAKRTLEETLKEIQRCSSVTESLSEKPLGQFDPSIVKAFREAYSEIKDIHNRLADKEFSFKTF